MNTIENLRKHRLGGIALFDLISSFIAAYILDYLFNVSYLLFGKITKNYKIIYYLSVIPFGIIAHIIFSQKTFLNTQLFSPNLNIYKIILLLLLGMIYYHL